MVLKKFIKKKRGMFFTMIVIALTSMFLLSYTIYEAVETRESVNDRIETMDNFIFSMEKDMSRQLYISGFRIIFSMEEHIVETGSYVNNVNSLFQEAFFNGTLYQDSEEIMLGATFSGIQNTISEKAAKINLNVTISSPSISISQDNPWKVKITLATDLHVRDIGNLASWDKTLESVSYISIENFEDPLYIVSARGKVANEIKKTPYTFSSDTANLSLHLEKSYYISSTSAPSFLDRLEGKTSGNENGIESLVYLPKLSAQGIPISEKSAVDYIYFSSDNPSFSSVAGMPSWFKLDTEHLSVYSASPA